ncbi:unnamed protein product [Jaminaea pallidilutea]
MTATIDTQARPRYPSSSRGPLGEATNHRYPSTSGSRKATGSGQNNGSSSSSSGLNGENMANKRSASSALSRFASSSASGASSSNPRDENTNARGAGDEADEEEWDEAPRRPQGKPRHSLNNRIPSQMQGRRVPSSRPAGVSSSDVGSEPSSRVASSSMTNRSGMSALARANARRVSMAPPGGLAAAQVPVQKLSVDSTSFEEWMKMATDNKINAANTFSIALIDYFHDMSLLRSDSGDGSINFQKASCTLDGCVKVWTSRVDSVVSETGKLLNGLVGDGKGVEADDGPEEELELDENGNPVGVKSSKDKKKRARAKEATLVKNFSTIAVKKLDQEYTVDPLFKKTSADFDEGGAGGLLMNHLGVDDKMRIVFDAGEAPGVPEDEEDETTLVEGQDDETAEATEFKPETIDLTRLQTKLFSLAPASFLAESSDPLSSLLNGRLICPSLGRFSFATEQSGNLFGQEDSDDEDGDEDGRAVRESTPLDFGPMNPAITATPWAGDDDPANAFAFDGSDPDDSGADLFGVPAEHDRDGDVFGMPDEPAAPNGGEAAWHDQAQGGGDDFDGFGDDMAEPPTEDDGGPMQWDPRQGPSRHDLLMAFQGVSGNDDEGAQGEGSSSSGAGGLFDYFDQKLMKSWAGPEHWKMRGRLAGFGGSAQAKSQNANGEGGDEAEHEAAKKKRAPKEAFVIDFTSQDAPSTKEIFEPPKAPTSILLPKGRPKAEAFLLPEDQHFSSRKLLRLFSKPRAVLNIRTRKGALRFGGGAGLPGFGAMPDDAEMGTDFWAQQQALRDADGGGFDDGADFGDGAPMPLDTQFYHDGDDEGAFEMASAMPQSDPNSAADVDVADFEEDDLAAQAAALRRVKPEYVNYAKKAKRVDVRKLKENILRELGIEGAVPTEEEQGDESHEAGLKDAAAVDGDAKTFRSVLTGLRKAYPKEKMEEISTSFCFICLLHLANEEGLELKIGGGEASQASAMMRRVNGVFATPGRIIEADEEDSDDDEADEDSGEESSGGKENLLGAGLNRGRGKKQKQSDNEDGADDDDEESEFKGLSVGRLEYLKIKRDPKAGKSA